MLRTFGNSAEVVEASHSNTLAGMTFEELLAQFGKQTQSEWLVLARKEWRGRIEQSFALDSWCHPKATDQQNLVLPFYGVEPYSAEDKSDTSLNPDADDSFPWTKLSDLRGELNDKTGIIHESLADVLLTELEGGSEGMLLNLSQIESLTSAAASIRFDYLKVYIQIPDTCNVEGSEIFDKLELLIPASQGREVGLRLPVALVRSAPSKGFATKFPKLRWTLSLTGDSAPNMVADLRYQLRIILAAEESEHLLSVLHRLTVMYHPPSDYLVGVSLPQAFREVIKQECLAAGLAQEKPMYTEISSLLSGTTATSHESYLIDATVRITAAVSGGVDAVIMAPYATEARYRREARNLQQVLALETGLGGAREAIRGATFFEKALHTLLEVTR